MVHPDALTTENPRTSDGKITSVAEALKLPLTSSHFLSPFGVASSLSNVYQNLPTMTEHKMHVNIRQFAHMLVSICYNNSNKMAIPFTYHSPERAQAGKGLANYAFSLPLYRSVLVVNGRICSSDETEGHFRLVRTILLANFALLRAKACISGQSAKSPGQIMLYFLVNFALLSGGGPNRALFYDYQAMLHLYLIYNPHSAKMRNRNKTLVKKNECITNSDGQAGKFCTISLAFSHSLTKTQYCMLLTPTTVEENK